MDQGTENFPIRLEVGNVKINVIAGVGSVNIGETYVVRLAESDSKKVEESITADAEPDFMEKEDER